jgi:hypothetical protein
MGEKRNVYMGLVRKLEEKKILKELPTDVSIILKWIFEKWDCRAWTELICLRTDKNGGLL